jgi:hypothetical protein
MNQRTYKIRSFSNGKNRKGEPFVNYSLTIPSNIAEKLPKEMQFYCELTEDGLLFRPVPPESDQVVLPPWAVNGTEDAAEKPKRTTRKKPTKTASKPRSRPSRSKPKPADPEPEPEPSQEPVPEPVAAEPEPVEATA